MLRGTACALPLDDASKTITWRRSTRRWGVTATSATRSTITIDVNGQPHVLDVDHRTTLLDLLREHLDLTGSKKGCDHGQCGACTVLLDDHRINSCLTLAVTVDGHRVTTVEGLGVDGLGSLQQAFVDHDALQCGYCTPGQVCSATGMLDEVALGWPSAVTAEVASAPRLNESEVRERMSGNLCRCGAYVNIVLAVLEVYGRSTAVTPEPDR
jgi:xanthine dehydrogenase YagT iron-sulfur-binding subunit